MAILGLSLVLAAGAAAQPPRAPDEPPRAPGIFGEAGGGEWARVAVAWLDWRLRGSSEAARAFQGSDCGLCGDGDWTVERQP